MNIDNSKATALAKGYSEIALACSVRILVAVVWASALIFGVYILIFFAGALITDDVGRWNQSLPDLFNPDNPVATWAIGIHFLGGGIILALGPIQFFSKVRKKLPGFHRWSGRLYIVTTFLAGVGGLLFIVFQGTIGGLPMNLGFGLYGVLMIWASIETFRHACARRLDCHRAWAMRLFALAIGSWLYRMEYGFWFLVFGELGHTKTFDGPFDIAMTFLFYLPNLVVVEVLLRAGEKKAGASIQWIISAVFIAASAFIVLATYKMTVRSWWPAIQSSLSI